MTHARTILAPEEALDERWRWLTHQGSADGVVKRQALEMIEDAASAEARVRQDYTGRYPLELLQNAHDASADAGHVGVVQFVVTPTALLVANEGVPFTYDRIKSLLRLGASEKVVRRSRGKLIGYKGIGFSSVFEICDRPQIISKTLAFGFDPELAAKRIREELGAGAKRLPVRPFAHRIADSHLAPDRPRVRKLLDAGAVTVVRLPLRPDRSPEKIEEDLRASITPEALLFMPAIREIRMSGPSLRFLWSRHRGRKIGKGTVVALRSGAGQQRSWLVRESSISVDKATVDRLRDDLWSTVRRLNVAVALPWNRRLDPSVGPQRLHVYFPTDDELGRAVLVHGDFYVQSSRRRIETAGAGGAITLRVADEAARLAAELAASVAKQGNLLLRTLAPRDEADGFGHKMGAILDEHLAEARIARASSGALRRPGAVRRLGTNLRRIDEEGLSSLAGSRSDILHPGDDAGEAADLLDALDVEILEADELARLLDASRAELSYGQIASLLVRWLDSLTGSEQTRAITALRQRPILQDARGRWARPDELVVRADDTVRMPKGLERREVSKPPGRYGKQLIGRLKVTVLDAHNAVETVVSAVERGRFGTSGSEARDVLRFLMDVWETSPDELRARHARLGAIRVPVKTAQRDKPAWRRGDLTYFSSAWVGDAALESLYGSYGNAEFLAEPVPREPRKRASRRAFFAALGVADAPRPTNHVSESWRQGRWTGLRRGWEWQQLPEFEKSECAAGHPESLRLRGTIADRLDELLGEDLTLRRTQALAIALSRHEQPYGRQAEIHCLHSAHYGRLVKRVPGYQRWLLENTEWVPVTGDPGGKKLRQPGDAWVDINPRDSWLTLPRVRLPKELRTSFDFSSAQRPRARALERALDYLAEAFDEPAEAPDDVRRTAIWLQERLDRALQRGSKPVEGPWLISKKGGEWAWNTDPLIADLPGIETFEGVTLLPPGGWRGLRAAYQLKRASEAVEIRVRAGKRVRSIGLLDTETRAQLLALLTKHGVDPEQTARRLALIRVFPVASLTIELSLDGARSGVQRSFHLEVTRTPRRIAAARLYYAPGEAINIPTLGREIATLLDEHQLAHAIALVLIDPDQALADEAVHEDELIDARRLLETARRRAHVPPDDEEEPEGADAEDDEQAESELERGDRAGADAGPRANGDRDAAGTDARTSDGRTTDDGRGSAEALAAPSTSDDRAGATDGHASPERPAKNLISERATFGAPKPGRRRERPRRERRPPRLTGTPGSGAFMDADPETEDRAMKIVARYGRDVLGAEVFDVHEQKKGWDLEFRLPDGNWQFIEVKGTSGEKSFPITRNERRAASDPEIGARYALYWVANAGAPQQAEIRRFPSIGLHMTEDVLDPLQWEVYDWSALPHQVIPLADETDD